MEITVSARHTEVSESLRQSAIEKIGRLSRFLEGMDRAEVHFSEERNPRIPEREICEVVLEGHGHHVRCKVSAPDGFSAVDKAVAKLETQLHKLKTKLQNRHQGLPKPVPAASEEELVAAVAGATTGEATLTVTGESGDGTRIVKVKRHELKPMTTDEAVLQLDLLGHDFFFFTNVETSRSAVLYRRGDGDLGLIDEAD